MLTQEELDKRFGYHKPRDQGVSNLHDIARYQSKMLATMLNEVVPSGREHSLVMTHLEEVMFWANAGIAREQPFTVVDKNELPTYKAEITVGMREGYEGPLHMESEVLKLAGEYCDMVGLGVEVHFGWCVYSHGMEPCVKISLINYPRFPSTSAVVFAHAEALGRKIAADFKQQRFTIVATDKTKLYEMGA